MIEYYKIQYVEVALVSNTGYGAESPYNRKVKKRRSSTIWCILIIPSNKYRLSASVPLVSYNLLNLCLVSSCKV